MKFTFCSVFLLSSLLLAGIPALAQHDLTGEYESMFHEDQPERIPGPALGDYLGLPISDAARAYAEAWDASRMTLKEHQCMVHVAPYIFRGPGPVRIWQEKDQETQEVTAIKIYHGTYQQTRTVWMDGRPHPPESALHTWMGFSTGKWEGDTLTVYTTHMKQGWLRRNGLPESDRATLTEHFIKHGDILTRMSMITDPVYLTEPLVKTDDFIRNTHLDVNWIWPCEPVEEVVTRAKGAVPQYLPGTNAFLKEFQETVHVPETAQRGGAQTMYPEFKTMLVAGVRTASGAVQPVRIQQSQIATDSEIHVIPVRENIYVLTGPGGNVTVQVCKPPLHHQYAVRPGSHGRKCSAAQDGPHGLRRSRRGSADRCRRGCSDHRSWGSPEADECSNGPAIADAGGRMADRNLLR